MCVAYDDLDLPQKSYFNLVNQKINKRFSESYKPKTFKKLRNIILLLKKKIVYFWVLVDKTKGGKKKSK